MSKNIPTAHIEAGKDDFAKTILMPGDPLRAKFVAENYLKNVKQVNGVRGMLAYTGDYKSKPVSVMASGMGMPSISIYSYELFNFYNVENIIRIGTAGAVSSKLKIKDIVVGMGACTHSNIAENANAKGFAPIADYSLLKAFCDTAQSKNINIFVGNLFSSDLFYSEDNAFIKRWSDMGVLAVEMEAAALYINAAKCGKKALAVCTVSNNLITGESTSSKERETSFNLMTELALNTVLNVPEL